MVNMMYKIQGADDSEGMVQPEADKVLTHKEKVRKGLAELLGTMILVLIGDGVVCQTVLSQGLAAKQAAKLGQNIDPTAFAGSWESISIGFGIALMVGVYVSAGVSGGHLNPAVSVTMCVFKKLPWNELPYYVSGQFAGAFIGAFFVYLGYRPALLEYDVWDKSTAGIFATYPAAHETLASGFMDEMIGSALLLLGIFAITDKYNNSADKGSQPAIIGLLLTGIALSFGYNTGFAVNPARDFGPRFFTLLAGWGWKVFEYDSGYFWVPLFAPFAGGILGALAYSRCVSSLNPQLGVEQSEKFQAGGGDAV